MSECGVGRVDIWLRRFLGVDRAKEWHQPFAQLCEDAIQTLGACRQRKEPFDRFLRDAALANGGLGIEAYLIKPVLPRMMGPSRPSLPPRLARTALAHPHRHPLTLIPFSGTTADQGPPLLQHTAQGGADAPSAP